MEATATVMESESKDLAFEVVLHLTLISMTRNQLLGTVSSLGRGLGGSWELLVIIAISGERNV